MREFKIRRGKHAGTHLIFDSITEATKHKVMDIKSPWHSENVEPGDWVVSDDGYVIQCLGKRKFVNKKHKSGQYTMTWRFPNGTFYIYRDAKGRKHIKNFYAVAAANHKSSMGNTPRTGRYMTLKKREFVSLVGSGLDPYQAYVKAFRVGTVSKNSIWIQVNKLLNDNMVKEELMEQMKPFLKKVEDRVYELTGHSNLADLLAERIAELVADKDMKASEIRQNVELALKLFGQPLGILPQSKNNKALGNLDDADYTLVPPPLLNQGEANVPPRTESGVDGNNTGLGGSNRATFRASTTKNYQGHSSNGPKLIGTTWYFPNINYNSRAINAGGIFHRTAA